MASVTLRNLNKNFGDVRAVIELDLEIEDGEFVTLLGPSGCGKTTTLNCIAGLEETTSGQILFDDHVVNDLAPRDRDVAMVFQDYALYPHMTIYENLAFGLKMRRVTTNEVDQRVRQVADILDIANLLDRRPSQLSGGQRQRVALGRAIVRDAVVFLMDEPLSNLDAALRVRTRSEIKALQRKLGTTTVYVTHDQEEAMVLSDRMAIMDRGVLQQYTTSYEAYNNPCNLFVAGFIGNPKMNFIKGSVESIDGGWLFSAQGLRLPLPASVGQGLRTSNQNDVTLGVRPEDIKVGREQLPGDIEGMVFMVEPVGPVDYVDLVMADIQLMASVEPGHGLVHDDNVRIHMNSEKLYLFDGQSGNRIA